ncbi:MAG: hypothetical protein H5T86_01705 [Armatimonadetes bacterium]|nr:hypothetical protein [Armatimonadota bacterium]
MNKRRGQSIWRRAASGAGRFLLRVSPGIAPGLACRLLAGSTRAEDHGWLRYAQALLAWRRGDHFAALDLLRVASAELPDEPGVAISLALALANVDMWDVAIEAGERVLRFFPDAADDRQLWQMLAWAYLLTGRYRTVIELMQRMHDAGASPSPIELQLLLARAVLLKQEPSVAHLRTLLRQSRSQLAVYFRFIEHLAESGYGELAAFLLAPLPPPAALRALDAMAHRAVAREQPSLALWAANALEKLEIGPEVARAIAALAAAAEGDLQAARRFADEAHALGPDHPLVQEKLAAVYMISGDREKALGAATRAIAAGSADAFSAGLLAAAILDKGDVRAAAQVFAEQRSGDALGAAVGHLAQARIYGRKRDWGDVEKLLRAVDEELQDVPAWARTEALVQFALSQLQDIRATDAPAHVRAAAEAVVERLEQLRRP